MRQLLFAFALIVSAAAADRRRRSPRLSATNARTGCAGRAADLRPASPSDPHVERRRAEDVRPGDGAGLRLQPRGRDPIVRARGRARSDRRHAALGQGVGARPELQPRHRRRAREGGVRSARESAMRSAADRPRAAERARLHRSARGALLGRSESRSRRRSRARSARRWAISRGAIPTISTPRPSTPKA